MAAFNNVQGQGITIEKVKVIEHLLDNVMEITDTEELKRKLTEVEQTSTLHPDAFNKVRLGITYHEVALNLSFFSNAGFQGYARKSFDTLDEIFTAPDTPQEMMPFVSAYRASAMALVSAETKKLRMLGDAFKAFADAVAKYSEVSYCPEFLRGSVSENMPWFLFSKRKFAKRDFQSIIVKQNTNPDYANWKIMSFVYWAWANQHQSKRYREQAIAYLDKAIALDPHYKAGRRKAEELKKKLQK